MRHWQRMFPGQIFDLSYEELVQDPETISRKLLQHCGLQWQPQVLAYQNFARGEGIEARNSLLTI